MTIIINGNELAKNIRSDILAQVKYRKAHNKNTALAVILVGNDPASNVYVNNKIKACMQCEIQSVLEQYDDNISESFLLDRIEQLNQDKNINGILVQLPLPKHIDSHKVIEAISAFKDVDGFHICNAGALMTGKPIFKPCTPYACMKILESINFNLKGANAVIIGASNIVGKPASMLLLQAGATVTICNSKTKDLKSHTEKADIIIIAAGKPKLLKSDQVKQGVIIIDVGINRLEDGSLCGDTDFDNIKAKTSYITPVPGGVGPMTITMLLQNTLQAAYYQDNAG